MSAMDHVNRLQSAFNSACKTAEDEGFVELYGWQYRLRTAVWGSEYKQKTSFNPAANQKDQFGAWRQEVVDEFREIDGIRSNITIRYAGNGSIKMTNLFVYVDRLEVRIWSLCGPAFFLDGPWWSDVERMANDATRRTLIALDFMRTEMKAKREEAAKNHNDISAKWQMRQFKDIAT